MHSAIKSQQHKSHMRSTKLPIRAPLCYCFCWCCRFHFLFFFSFVFSKYRATFTLWLQQYLLILCIDSTLFLFIFRIIDDLSIPLIFSWLYCFRRTAIDSWQIFKERFQYLFDGIKHKNEHWNINCAKCSTENCTTIHNEHKDWYCMNYRKTVKNWAHAQPIIIDKALQITTGLEWRIFGFPFDQFQMTQKCR